jgi:hypothetical protein
MYSTMALSGRRYNGALIQRQIEQDRIATINARVRDWERRTASEAILIAELNRLVAKIALLDAAGSAACDQQLLAK